MRIPDGGLKDVDQLGQFVARTRQYRGGESNGSDFRIGSASKVKANPRCVHFALETDPSSAPRPELALAASRSRRFTGSERASREWTRTRPGCRRSGRPTHSPGEPSLLRYVGSRCLAL